MNTTMDVAATRQLLRNLIQAYETLGIDEQNVVKWKELLAKMPEYRITGGRERKTHHCRVASELRQQQPQRLGGLVRGGEQGGD